MVGSGSVRSCCSCSGLQRLPAAVWAMWLDAMTQGERRGTMTALANQPVLCL